METNNNEQYILLLKLSTGDEIISKVDEDSNGNMLLTKPYAFETSEDSKGNVSGGFVPYMPLAEDSLVQLIQRPIAISTPNKKAVESYLRLIGDSVIETPQSGLIIPR